MIAALFKNISVDNKSIRKDTENAIVNNENDEKNIEGESILYIENKNSKKENISPLSEGLSKNLVTDSISFREPKGATPIVVPIQKTRSSIRKSIQINKSTFTKIKKIDLLDTDIDAAKFHGEAKRLLKINKEALKKSKGIY
jgi:hypothetical protein